MYLEYVYKQRLDKSFLILSVPYDFIRYGNNNFARDPEDRKSVIRYCFFLNNGIVLWSIKNRR